MMHTQWRRHQRKKSAEREAFANKHQASKEKHPLVVYEA